MSLSERLASGKIELVLCGPILRRCEPTSATVWLALQRPCTVTLTVIDPGGKRGNTPERFAPGTNGGKLLDALASWCAFQLANRLDDGNADDWRAFGEGASNERS